MDTVLNIMGNDNKKLGRAVKPMYVYSYCLITKSRKKSLAFENRNQLSASQYAKICSCYCDAEMLPGRVYLI